MAHAAQKPIKYQESGSASLSADKALSQVHKEEVVTIRIEDISQDGEGIGHSKDGFTLFIKDAVIGDTVEAKVIKVKKSYGYGRLIRVVSPSPFRVTPRCPVARQCGGCQLQALSYEQQLAFKQNKVRNDLIRIGGFSWEEADHLMRPIVGMQIPWHYRNKTQLPVGTDREGEPMAGFYAGRTHVIIPVSDCCIGAEGNQQIVDTILDWMKRCHIPAYDEHTGKGLIRHILIRTGTYSHQIMVCLVINSPAGSLSHTRELVQALTALPGMTSISLNVNQDRTNVILGRTTQTLWGTEDIEDDLHIFTVTYDEKDHQASFAPAPQPPVRFHISPRSFYQVNSRQAEKLYSLVLHEAKLTGSETVWDLYCGVGTISLFLARFAQDVYGVEVVPEAIQDARRNARLNGIHNAHFETGKVEDILPSYVEKQLAVHRQEENKPIVDVVVVDPPRKGCDEKCLQTILEVLPERIIYVSCDPATLARDLKILVKEKYQVESIQAVDQFSQTVHVEVVAAMSRKQ